MAAGGDIRFNYALPSIADEAIITSYDGAGANSAGIRSAEGCAGAVGQRSGLYF